MPNLTTRIGDLFRGREARAARLLAASSAAAQPAPAAQDPKPAELSTVKIALRTTDFAAYYTAAGLTPAYVANALTQADRGSIRALAEITESALERDAHIAGILRTRRLAVAGAPWKVSAAPAEAEDTDNSRNEEIAADCEAMLRAIPRFSDALLSLTDFLVYPVAALAHRWEFDGRFWRIAELQRMPAKRFAWNTTYTDGVTMGQLGDLRLLTEAAQVNGEALEPWNWTIITDNAIAAWPFRGGLGRLLLWQFLFKIYAVKDWSTFAELCGLPLIWAQCDLKAPDADRAALESAMASLGTEATGIFSPGTELKIIDRANHDGIIFEKLTAFCDAQNTKAVLGHVASSDAVPGSLGGAETTAVDVRQDLREADARIVNQAIGDGILLPYVRLNWGDDPVPRFELDVAPPEDLKARAEIDKMLVEVGLPLGRSYFYSTYGRPEPAEDEPIVKPPTPALAGGGGGIPGLEAFMPPAEATQVRIESAQTAIVQAAAGDLPERVRQIDSLFAAALKRSYPTWEQYLQPVRAALETARDFGQLRSLLEALELKPEAVAELLQATQQMGYVLGWAQVAGEIGQLQRDIGLSFEPLKDMEAYRWLQSRAPMDYADYKRASTAIRNRSFALAAHESAEVAARVKDQIEQAIDQGLSYGQFKSNYAQMASDLGVTPANPYHLETVFRNATSNASNVGRLQKMRRPEVVALRPYWQYRTVGDSSVRPEHAELHGMTYPHDHAFWATYYPPCGHNCRCNCISLSTRQAKDIRTEIPADIEPPPEGWDTAPDFTEPT